MKKLLAAFKNDWRDSVRLALGITMLVDVLLLVFGVLFSLRYLVIAAVALALFLGTAILTFWRELHSCHESSQGSESQITGCIGIILIGTSATVILAEGVGILDPSQVDLMRRFMGALFH